MDEILHHFETIGNYRLLAFYRGSINLGFLRWCRISSIHDSSEPNQPQVASVSDMEPFLRDPFVRNPSRKRIRVPLGHLRNDILDAEMLEPWTMAWIIFGHVMWQLGLWAFGIRSTETMKELAE